MSKGKNLKEKELNKVSGGGVINLMSNPRYADFLRDGKLPAGVSEDQMMKEIHFVEHVFDKGYMTPSDKKRLVSLGFKM